MRRTDRMLDGFNVGVDPAIGVAKKRRSHVGVRLNGGHRVAAFARRAKELFRSRSNTSH